MLGKLIKHEFKAVNRLMIPLHLGLIIVTIVGRFYVQFSISRSNAGYDPNSSLWLWEGLMNVMLLSSYIIALVAIYLIPQLYLNILRPRKNLFTDEGYLMHTLPASAAEHIVSKLVVSCVWRIANVFLVCLSVIIMVVNKAVVSNFWEFWDELWSGFTYMFDVQAGLGMSAFLIVALIELVSGTLIIYMCIAIGHSFNSHKILASIGIYIGYSMVSNLITSLFTALSGVGMMGNMNASKFFFGIGTYNSRIDGASYFWLNLGFTGVYCLILGVAAFILTNHFMSKRLNLE